MTAGDDRLAPFGASGASSQKSWLTWTTDEVGAIRKHPDWTAAELHEIIPRHSVEAIRSQRKRMGRYSPDAVPLCQRCGEHPVWTDAADARRWGLCKACALEEREYRLRHGGELSRKDNALRQAKWKSRNRKKGGDA